MNSDASCECVSTYDNSTLKPEVLKSDSMGDVEAGFVRA